MAISSPSAPAWRFQDHGKAGSTALVRLAETTVERFRARGVLLPAGNRLLRAADAIRDSHELRIPVTHDDPANAALVAEAIRDMWDYYLIARTLPVERDADMDGKLKLMLRGDSLAATDESSTPRDLQFEFLVGAVFAMADIPTRPAEPDLRFMLGSQEWGAAVKRVRSGNQLAKRATRAREQLEEHNLRGVIVVNVDAFLEGVPASGAPEGVGRKFETGVERLLGLFPHLAKQRSLLGVVAMGRVVGWGFDTDKPHLFHPWILKASAFTDDGPAGRVVDELFERLQQRAGARMDVSLREIEQSLTG